MMMQMLQAGGLSLLTDQKRAPDENNPRGYFEFEPVKKLRVGDVDWLDAARGQGIKIISALLQEPAPSTSLPDYFHAARHT